MPPLVDYGESSRSASPARAVVDRSRAVRQELREQARVEEQLRGEIRDRDRQLYAARVATAAAEKERDAARDERDGARCAEARERQRREQVEAASTPFSTASLYLGRRTLT